MVQNSTSAQKRTRSADANGRAPAKSPQIKVVSRYGVARLVLTCLPEIGAAFDCSGGSRLVSHSMLLLGNPWLWPALALAASLVAMLALAVNRRQAQRLSESQKGQEELEKSSKVLEEERRVLELIARGASLKEVPPTASARFCSWTRRVTGY
jgi:hypothetical protein